MGDHSNQKDERQWQTFRSDFKWPVSGTQHIQASANEVWRVISSPGNLELCHPFCLRNPVESWPGADARDRIEYLSGWSYQRTFISWMDGEGYDLEIGREGGGQSFVSWRIYPHDKTSASLSITVYPHVFQDLPAILRWFPYSLYIIPRLKSYLRSVTRGFEWYITKGESVPRNQFGKHPWYS